MSQEYTRSTRDDEENNPWEASPEDLSEQDSQTQEVVDESDEMLDEIDEILEGNAEEFIRGFIQKGGQ